MKDQLPDFIILPLDYDYDHLVSLFELLDIEYDHVFIEMAVNQVLQSNKNNHYYSFDNVISELLNDSVHAGVHFNYENRKIIHEIASIYYDICKKVNTYLKQFLKLSPIKMSFYFFADMIDQHSFYIFQPNERTVHHNT